MTAARTKELDAAIMRWFIEMPEDFEHRLLRRLVGHPDPHSCWCWPHPNNKGYGTVRLPAVLGIRDSNNNTASVRTHRAVWLVLIGPIEPSLVLDHDDPVVGCKNRACANPEHLVAVPPRVNVVVNSTSVTAEMSRRTHCPAGHPLNGPDAELMSSTSHRICRLCNTERGRTFAALERSAQQALGIKLRKYREVFGRSAATAGAVLWAAEACAAAAKSGHSTT
jgi:hypothetical protein